jgi:hypothetical protein
MKAATGTASSSMQRLSHSAPPCSAPPRQSVCSSYDRPFIHTSLSSFKSLHHHRDTVLLRQVLVLDLGAIRMRSVLCCTVILLLRSVLCCTVILLLLILVACHTHTQAGCTACCLYRANLSAARG